MRPVIQSHIAFELILFRRPLGLLCFYTLWLLFLWASDLLGNFRRLVLVLAVSCTGLLLPVVTLRPAAAQAVAGSLGAVPSPARSYRLDFGAVRPVEVSQDATRREVVLRFVSPVPAARAEEVISGLGSLMEGYSLGYDSIRLRLAAPAHAYLADADNRAVVIETVGEEHLDPAAERRLIALEARLQARRGDSAAARARLEAALRDNPSDIDLLSALAATEEESGAWWRGVTLYDRALSIDPQAGDISRARDALAMRFGPSLRADAFSAFGANGERTYSGLLTAEAPIGSTWRLEFNGEVRRAELRTLPLSTGASITDYSDTKLRGEVAVSHRWDASGTTRAAAFGADHGPGFGLQHRWAWWMGETAVFGAWRRPYWESTSAFAADAWRDIIGVSHGVNLTPSLALRLELGGVRYGVPDEADVTSGTALGGGITYMLPPDTLPLEDWDMRLNYRVAAEYLRQNAADALRGRADAQPLFDVRDREIHTVDVTLQGMLGPGSATAVAGWAWDRYAGSGPVALLRYANAETGLGRPSFGVEAAVAPSLAISARPVWRLGGFFVWHFGL
jgi:hypothetical protein